MPWKIFQVLLASFAGLLFMNAPKPHPTWWYPLWILQSLSTYFQSTCLLTKVLRFETWYDENLTKFRSSLGLDRERFLWYQRTYLKTGWAVCTKFALVWINVWRGENSRNKAFITVTRTCYGCSGSDDSFSQGIWSSTKWTSLLCLSKGIAYCIRYLFNIAILKIKTKMIIKQPRDISVPKRVSIEPWSISKLTCFPFFFEPGATVFHHIEGEQLSLITDHRKTH